MPQRDVVLEIKRDHEYYGCHPGQERAVEVTETRQQLLLMYILSVVGHCDLT